MGTRPPRKGGMGESSVLATWRAFELICDAVSEPCCSLEVDATSWAAFEALRAISILNMTEFSRFYNDVDSDRNED